MSAPPWGFRTSDGFTKHPFFGSIVSLKETSQSRRTFSCNNNQTQTRFKMTISRIIVCTTCGHKIKLRHQIGLYYPVKVNIPCNGCGKTLKGEVTKNGDIAFVFPNENVTMDFDGADQTISISTELPIVKKETNVNILAPTPFLAISPRVFSFDELGTYMTNLQEFKSIHDEKLEQLITSYELFENRNWHHFLEHLKNNFDEEIELDI